MAVHTVAEADQAEVAVHTVAEVDQAEVVDRIVVVVGQAAGEPVHTVVFAAAALHKSVVHFLGLRIAVEA